MLTQLQVEQIASSAGTLRVALFRLRLSDSESTAVLAASMPAIIEYTLREDLVTPR